MADEKNKWRQFQRLKFDSKNLSKRVKKAEGTTTRHAHKFIVKRIDNIRYVRRQIISWLLLIGITIAASGAQLLWFQQSYQTSAAADGGTYAEATVGPINTLNPLYAASDAEASLSRLLFSSLYTYDKTGHLHGDMASNMHIDKTNTIYTLTLRPNMQWHDSTPLTARDVAFTVNLIKNPETRSPLRINWQDVEVNALNDQTVEFVLPAAYAAFPYALTFPVLPEHILSNVAPGALRENSFSRSPVGSGPFSFTLLRTADTGKDNTIVQLAAFDKYYGGMPKLGRFEIHAYTNEEDIMHALRTSEVSAATAISATDLHQIDTRTYNVTSHPINSGTYALFNTTTPVLKDRKVRRALQLATDTTALRSSLPASVPPLDLPFIQNQVPGTESLHAPRPDSKKAAALLDKAGWKLVNGVRQKHKQTLSLNVTTTKDDQYEKVLEGLAGQWGKIGVKVQSNVIDENNVATNFTQNTLQPRNYDVLIRTLSIGADPDVYAYWHSSQIGFSGYNFSNYTNKTADAALGSARARLEPELRNAKYTAFAKQWLDDAPAIGLYQAVTNYASNKHVTSLDPSAKFISSNDRYNNILYWTVRQQPVYKTP